MDGRQGFLPVEVEWAGKKYTIPARSIMPLLAQIESHVTLAEIQSSANRGTLPQAKIAQAYTIVLNYLGIEIESDQVYMAMFPGPGSVENQAIAAVQGIMHLMLPPKVLAKRMEAMQSGKASAPVTTREASSKRRSRRG